MARGGKRPGAGRPKGAVGKLTKELRERLQEDGDPVPVLVQLLKHEDAAIRLGAAKNLMPYVYPRLAAQRVEHSGEMGVKAGVAEVPMKQLEAEWDAEHGPAVEEDTGADTH